MNQSIHVGDHRFEDERLETAINFAKLLGYPVFIDNVDNCSYKAEDGLTFGDLQRAGLLEKNYIPGCGYPDFDPVGIRWEVIGDISFRDIDGTIHKKGDVIEWAM